MSASLAEQGLSRQPMSEGSPGPIRAFKDCTPEEIVEASGGFVNRDVFSDGFSCVCVVYDEQNAFIAYNHSKFEGGEVHTWLICYGPEDFHGELVLENAGVIFGSGFTTFVAPPEISQVSDTLTVERISWVTVAKEKAITFYIRARSIGEPWPDDVTPEILSASKVVTMAQGTDQPA